ncbi:putative O-glycosylation ligase, exosortase A system-associated [Roseateles oligotrophus]|uniref:O-glycosylation ligase, exosortase A system-associated n=1 Tax=Roseateles oligotrophus TaxID=1769250 RepID=A0ABT2YFE3_9BURK|nr:putative O-glycosylation ligase, exosortase A system-associated [Roseateles oligotrophus]MCV2368739.1 putative O-glycosylation ligase, exosortase A system-associated [Roseateles oligotrophus]
MRDIALLAVFLAALPYAFRHTWVGVLLWTWVSIMNPHKLAFGFAQNMPFAAIAAGVTLVSVLVNRDKLKLDFTPPIKVLCVFIFWMCLTTAFSVHFDPSLDYLKKVMKIQLMTLIAAAALRERKHIELFIWVNAMSIGFYGLKGGLFTIRSGGGERVWGPPGGFIEGNNELALALVMTIPLINYLRMVATGKRLRLGLLVLIGLCAIAALGSQSRGALLAIAAMGLVLWTRSDKKFAMAAVLLLAGFLLLSFMPESWSTRMNTIKTYEEDGSALGRINAWWFAFNLANDRPLGAGFQTATSELFSLYAPDPTVPRAAHSIYFSVLGEHGWGGLMLFLLLWIFLWKMGAAIRKQAKDEPELSWLYHLAGMCQVSIAGYLVGGAFLSLAYFDLPYNIAVILSTSYVWMKAKRWQTDKQGALGAGAPVSQIRTAAIKRAQTW